MKHGGNVYAIAAALGRPVSEIVDMSASINPLGMPAPARRAILEHVNDVLHYPDPECSALKAAAAGRYGLDPSCVLPANGSTELIYLLPRVLKPVRVVIPFPTFSEYARASARAEAKIIHVPLIKESGFGLDASAFKRAIRRAGLAFLCNPGNPSGRAVRREVVLDLVRAAERAESILVVDEAFMEFCPGHSVIDIKSDSLIVLRSLTKFYGLAGLRAAFGVLPPWLMKLAAIHKEPWSMNVLAERASSAALSDTAFADKTRGYVGREKRRLERAFDALGIKYYPSDANYYLLESPRARDMADGLLRRGIAVRDCSDFKGLDSSHIRLAVRSRRENALLIDALSSIMAGGR